jgi:hypothetical protein
MAVSRSYHVTTIFYFSVRVYALNRRVSIYPQNKRMAQKTSSFELVHQNALSQPKTEEREIDMGVAFLPCI